MQRKVEGLENLNNILTLPIGSTFGMFADDTPSGPKWYRDILHQHDRTQQRQTLKGNLK